MLAYTSLLSDLDGTLIDSSDVINNAFEELCNKNVLNKIKSEDKNILFKSPQKALKIIGGSDLNKYWISFEKHINKARPYQAIKPTLTKLKQQGLSIGVVTSLPAERASLLIQTTGMAALISFVIGWQYTVPRKPQPHQIYKALEKLHDRTRVLYIGDSQDDMIAGNRAGVKTGFVTWGYYLENDLTEKPDYIISTVSQLDEIIRDG